MDRILHVFTDPPLDGATNMARDEHLLHSTALRPAALRIYAWDPPTISLGYFQRYAELARLPDELRGLAVVRRLTGGGAILHDREVTYCLVLDDSQSVVREPSDALYETVHRAWRAVLASDGLDTELAPRHFPPPRPRSGPFFCFETPGRTDLLLRGAKLLGSAQRRIPGRVLQHGSLLLGRRFAAHPGADLGQPAAERVRTWIDAFIDHLAADLRVTMQPAEWNAQRLADVAKRRGRYGSDAWIRRH